MARGFPSMTALLGLLAVAGYQNRDKIAEYLRSSGSQSGSQPPAAGGSDVSGFLHNSLGELVERFRQTGLGAAAESWIGTGPNQQVSGGQLEQALGPEMLDELSRKSGLSKNEILSRLATTLPSAVDSYTPQGTLPADGRVP